MICMRHVQANNMANTQRAIDRTKSQHSNLMSTKTYPTQLFVLSATRAPEFWRQTKIMRYMEIQIALVNRVGKQKLSNSSATFWTRKLHILTLNEDLKMRVDESCKLAFVL